MLLILTKESTGEEVILTLTEKSTITAPHYLFVAEHITTKETVRFVLPVDGSTHPERYNSFQFSIIDYFSTATLGQWLYRVYEQASAINTDETGLNEVENGRMNLISQASFAPAVYTTTTNFKTYGG